MRPEHTEEGSQDFADFASLDRGYYYKSAVDYSRRNKAFMFTSDKRDEDFDLNGSMSRGRCTATVRADVDIGNQDRVILKEAVRASSIEVTRAASGQIDTVDLRWIQSVLLVFDGTSEYVVNQEVRLVTDVQTGESQLYWTSGSGPAAGAKYSMNVTCWPVWIVEGKPMRRGFTEKEAGTWRVDLRLDDERVRRG